jgi:hypothetical protein
MIWSASLRAVTLMIEQNLALSSLPAPIVGRKVDGLSSSGTVDLVALRPGVNRIGRCGRVGGDRGDRHRTFGKDALTTRIVPHGWIIRQPSRLDLSLGSFGSVGSVVSIGTIVTIVTTNMGERLNGRMRGRSSHGNGVNTVPIGVGPGDTAISILTSPSYHMSLEVEIRLSHLEGRSLARFAHLYAHLVGRVWDGGRVHDYGLGDVCRPDKAASLAIHCRRVETDHGVFLDSGHRTGRRVGFRYRSRKGGGGEGQEGRQDRYESRVLHDMVVNH